jgi:hypothetical protein
MYFPRNWEFGLAVSKLRNFGVGGGGGLNPPNTPLSVRTLYCGIPYYKVYTKAVKNINICKG